MANIKSVVSVFKLGAVFVVIHEIWNTNYNWFSQCHESQQKQYAVYKTETP